MFFTHLLTCRYIADGAFVSHLNEVVQGCFQGFFLPEKTSVLQTDVISDLLSALSVSDTNSICQPSSCSAQST